ncbi:MAG TPA: tetratricopeptide repeat protein [Candidatus Polarisedimenticolaceae bacterium]|nr:tetratricopeptide repeat protein [Candidatus Polarisedimenticolaceae bacterium]
MSMMKLTRPGPAIALAALLLSSPLFADDGPSARLLAASHLQEAGDHQAAIELLEQIREIEPDNKQVLYGLAISLYAVGNYREAAHVGATLLAEANDAASGSAQIYLIVGSAYGRLNAWEESEKTLSQGMTRWPDDQALKVQHAITLEGLGRMDEAVAELEACLQHSPYDPALWRALGDALSVTGAPGRAFAAYVRALTLGSDDAHAKDIAASLWSVLFRGAAGQTGDAGEKAEAKGLALVAALRRDDKWAAQSDARFFAYALDTSLQLVSALHGKKTQSEFWGPFILDYFDEVRAAGLMETLAYEVRRSSGDPDVARWLNQNTDKVERFRNWSERWSVHYSEVEGRERSGS